MSKIKVNRNFNWVSSSDEKNIDILGDLNKKMAEFYSRSDSRDQYQEMLDSVDNEIENPGIVTTSFMKYIESLYAQSLLEVGCGSGRIFQFLNNRIKDIQYTGIELSEKVIQNNKRKYPFVNWEVAGAYNIPLPDNSVDICFSFYVLEHLVFPEKALNEMLRTVKKDGHLILIFPDFVASGRFASQRLGLSDIPTSLEKIKKSKFIDAAISLYDSRIRLPKALKTAQKTIGSFPVNTTPKCLDEEFNYMNPDVDAIYIASKTEIINWALQKGFTISLPAGETDYFSDHAFISIKKND